jgi:hypothetical protein
MNETRNMEMKRGKERKVVKKERKKERRMK